MGSKPAACLSLLEDCLALQLVRSSSPGPPVSPRLGHDSTYWLYDSGYLLYQGFVEANLSCSWDAGLRTAVRDISFRGYVAPGILLVGGSQPALHLLRSAWARRVLKPPPSYRILLLGDVEDCIVSRVEQTSFSPLPDAICWTILQLGVTGETAVLDTVAQGLAASFPEMEQPSRHLLYDTLADLMAEGKIYQTAQGYFISKREAGGGGRGGEDQGRWHGRGRQVLLSHEEAAAIASGEMVTIREGHRTHQSIQTCLADVICGGNKSDKVIYPRVVGSRETRRKLERRHSMRLLGSSRRLAGLQRAGSVRLLHPQTSPAPQPQASQKKSSLFSKLFRWKRSVSPGGRRAASPVPAPPFPPQEWFNSTVLGLRSVATQTKTMEEEDEERSLSARTRRRSLSTSRLPRRRLHDVVLRPTEAEPGAESRAEGPSRGISPSPSKAGRKAFSTASSGYNSLPRRRHQETALRPPEAGPLPDADGEPGEGPSRISTPCSSKAVTPPKAFSSASSGYNSLPRSRTSRNRPPPAASSNSSLRVEVSHQGSTSSAPSPTPYPKVNTTMSASINNPSATLTTTIDGPNSTKIFVQQLNSPVRSVITVEKGRKIEKSKEEIERSTPKAEQRRCRRPLSLYQKEPVTETLKNNSEVPFLSNNIKMKFPSSETIQMEEKLLTGNKNNKNELQKNNIFDPLKTGSLINVRDCTKTEGEMNNVRKASGPLLPLQPALSSDKALESLSYKNVLKESVAPDLAPLPQKGDKNNCYTSNNKLNSSERGLEGPVKRTEGKMSSFPSLSDLSLHFTSIAAQNILSGVSINSLDTLVESTNEKNSIKEMSIHTDMGIV